MEINVQLPRVFLPLERPARYKAVYGGRGSGKSHNRAAALVEDCLNIKGLRAVCIREVQKTLKESSKRLIEDKLKEYRLGLRQGFRVFKEVIQTPGDGVITFQGMQDHTAESIKSLEGFHRAWVEEAQTLSARSLQLLRPTIRAEDSEIWFSWNPRRKTDPVDFMFRGPEAPSNAVVVQANWSDNPFFPDVLEQERLDDLRINPDQYQHIWEGGYATVSVGAYYARNIAEARKDGRIGRVPPDPLMKYHLFADIGGTGAKADAFVFWVAQVIGKEIRVLNYYEVVGQPLESHLNWMRSNGYEPSKSQIWLPHDGATQDKVFAVSYQSAFESAGYNVEVVPNQGRGAASIRIEAGRRWFGSCFFHEETTMPGIEALGSYHERKDADRNIGLGPEHDWSSHGCFTADTEVLTRYGMYQIIDLPENGEVLTSCGWKTYQNPRMTRKNARLVAVTFTDGLTVKCTPDHLFKTVNGWKSAESLTNGSEILSTLTNSRNTLTGGYTECGLPSVTCHEAGENSTGMYGGKRLVKYLKDATYTIKTVTYRTIGSLISNVSPLMSILNIKTTKPETVSFLNSPELEPPHGMAPPRVGYGIKDTPNVHKAGPSGNVKKSSVLFAKSNFPHSLERVETHKSTVPGSVKPTHTANVLKVESVEFLNERQDVYCMTVPDAGEFSLANGAVVHNCDAFGLMCVAVEEIMGKPKSRRDETIIIGGWMG